MSSFILKCEVPENEAGRLNEWLCSVEVQTILGPKRIGNLTEYGFKTNEDMLFANDFIALVIKHRRLNIPSKIHKIE